MFLRQDPALRIPHSHSWCVEPLGLPLHRVRNSKSRPIHSLGPPAADYGLRLVLFRKLHLHCTTYISLSLPECSCTIPAPVPLIKTSVASIIPLGIAFFALSSNAPSPWHIPNLPRLDITSSAKQKQVLSRPIPDTLLLVLHETSSRRLLERVPPRSFPKETAGRGRGITPASPDDNVQSPPQIIYDQPSSLDAGCRAKQPTQATSPEPSSSSEISQTIEINAKRHDVPGPRISSKPACGQPTSAQPRADPAEVHAAPGRTRVHPSAFGSDLYRVFFLNNHQDNDLAHAWPHPPVRPRTN